jgi:hypothetical protein
LPASNKLNVVCHAARQADRVAPAQTQRATGQADPQGRSGTLPCRTCDRATKASQ